MARTAAQKSNRPKRARNDAVYYVVEITDWDWSFSFGLGWRRDIDRGPYSDYRHLTVKGNLLRPLKSKAREVEISLLPSLQLNETERSKDEPNAVGSIDTHRGIMKPLLSMPLDALDSVLQMLIANRFKYVVMNGEKLRYGRGSVTSYRFECTIDEDDLPPED